MPSGSKKRKSSKKLKSLGGPPELDVGLEEAMANTEEEVGEPSPSPVGIEGDPEAMADTGFDSNELRGKALQDAVKEDLQIGEADREGDPPPLAEPEQEIPPAIEAKPPPVNEREAETAPYQEILSRQNDAIPEEIKTEEKYDAGAVDPQPPVDATLDAPLEEIKPDAGIGLDESKLSNESPNLERDFDLDAAPLSSVSEIDKPFVDAETETDATSTDVVPKSGKAADEPDVAAAPEDESGFDKSFVDVDATSTEPERDESDVAATPEDELLGKEGDGAPLVAQGTDEAPNEALVEVEPGPPIKPEAEVEESETEEGLRERELLTEEAPTQVDMEAEEKQVEEAETAAPIDIEPVIEEAPIERESEVDAETAAPTTIEPLTEEAPFEKESGIGAEYAEDPETAAPTTIELLTEEAPLERESEVDAETAEELETAAPVDIEPVTEEVPIEREAEINAEGGEELETSAPVDIEPATEEVPIEREAEINAEGGEELETAPPTDIEAVTEEARESEAAAPIDIELVKEEALIEREPEKDAPAVAELEEGSDERELAMDVAIADVEPETEAAPLDVDGEIRTDQVETDALQDKTPPEIDAANPENDTELDVAARDYEPGEDAPVVEPEPPMEVSPVEIEPEVSAEQASIEAAPEPEPQEDANAEDLAAPDREPEGGALVKEEPELHAEDAANPAEIDARTVPPEETKLETKPLDLDEDTSFEPSHVIEPESEVEEIDKAKLEDEALAEIKAEESGSVETEASQQDFAEGEGNALPENNPEADVEPPRGIELDAEAVDSPEAESESVAEAPVETKLDEKELIHAEADQQDLAGIRTDQSGGKEEDVQLQTQAGEPETNELESSVSDVYQTSESQPQVADALEVPAVENEPFAIPASEAEPKEGDSITLLATDLEGKGESTIEAVSESQDSRGGIYLPPAEGVSAEGLSKEDSADQEQAADVGHGEDEPVLMSSGNGGEAEVSSEQELSNEQPLAADVVDVEESVKETPPLSDQSLVADIADIEEHAKEEPPLSDQELVSQQPQPLINLESASAEPEKDIGEEEAASSTMAEAGSVLNDSDGSASCYQELPTDFTSTEQKVDVPNCKQFDDHISSSIPEFVETGSTEQLDSESLPAEKVDADTPSQEEATSEQRESLLENADAAEPAKDLVFTTNAPAAELANDLHPAPAEEIPSDEQVPSMPQPVHQDEVYTSREVGELQNEEPKAGEDDGIAHESEDKLAVNAMFPNVAGDELVSSVPVHLENGQQSIGSLGGPSDGVMENGAESGVFYQGEANDSKKAEIDAVDSEDSKKLEAKPAGASDFSDESAPPISEGRDIKGFEAFRQQGTPETSVPVLTPSQDRDVEVANPKKAERPSEGGALKPRSKLLDCCGMFDLLLKRN